jgi:hypothetical protein
MNQEASWPTVGSWEESVLLGLSATKKQVHLRELSQLVKAVRQRQSQKLSATWEATIRRTLQESPLFCQSTPKSGFWGLSAEAKKLLAQVRRSS